MNIYRVSQTNVSIKNSYSDLFTASIHSFEFMWIQYICKFYLVYHLTELDAPGQSYSNFSETYAFFKGANSVEKQLLNFKSASVSHCFRNLSLNITWNNLGLSHYKHMKRNLEFRK